MRAPDTAGLDYSNGQALTVRGGQWSKLGPYPLFLIILLDGTFTL